MKLLGKINSFFNYKNERKNYIPTAEEAYYITKYGGYTTIENRIKYHQKNIRNLIESKMRECYSYHTDCSSFYCTYDFNEDMRPYIEDVLKPFKEKGFNVVNITDKVKELSDDIIYIITWKKK